MNLKNLKVDKTFNALYVSWFVIMVCIYVTLIRNTHYLQPYDSITYSVSISCVSAIDLKHCSFFYYIS